MSAKAASPSSSSSSAPSSSASAADRASDSDIVNKFQALRQEQQLLVQKKSELEADATEHKLVIDTIKDLDPARKCFRLVGGVLVERTVGEVLPALQSNYAGITTITKKLEEDIVAKGKELTAFKLKYNIKIKGEDDDAAPAAGAKGKPATAATATAAAAGKAPAKK